MKYNALGHAKWDTALGADSRATMAEKRIRLVTRAQLLFQYVLKRQD